MEDNSPASPSRPSELSYPQPSRSKTRKAIVWVLVLLFFGALFLFVFRSQRGSQNAMQSAMRAAAGGAVAVVPATAQGGSIGVYQEAIGTVTPVFTSSVVSQVTGLVTAVHYREGQRVRKGEPLIDIDSRAIAAQLAQAEGTLEKDQHILAQSQMDLERYRAAWARNAIARQTLDDQEKLVSQNQAAVKSDEGQVAYDKVQLSYCHITSPFNGRVGLRLVDPGNVVQANSTSPLVVVTQEDPITVIFTVPEDALATIQNAMHGSPLQVFAYDRAALTKIATGRLQTIDNQVDTTTGTVKLRALFDNKNGVLFPNQFVNTRLLVTTLNNQILIPTVAIQHNGQQAFVYVLQNGEAQMRNVKPGAVDSGMTAVEGLQAGEVVANSSFEKLRPGVKVQIAQQNGAANTPVQAGPGAAAGQSQQNPNSQNQARPANAGGSTR